MSECRIEELVDVHWGYGILDFDTWPYRFWIRIGQHSILSSPDLDQKELG